MGTITFKMKASTFAIFLTFAVILAAASAQEEAQEVSDIENEFLGELDTDAASPEVNDIESEVEAKTRPHTLPPAVRRRLNRILVKKHFRCHYNQNWVNGMRYSQKVIKASSRAAAAQMCVNDCARMKGCTGFFYQKHRNGHQICGFYKSKIGAGSWHGHAEGAVCRYSHTTRHLHRGQEQALDTDEEEVASSEIEAENAASPEVNDIESEVEAKTKGWGRRRRRLNRILVKKHFRCHYNQNWVNGMRYSQKVIKASSRAAAAQMCVNDCARMAGCTGFFYQKHKNGHQICGFYKSKIGAGSWHGHAEGAVCRYSHTTHHRGQEQALDTDTE